MIWIFKFDKDTRQCLYISGNIYLIYVLLEKFGLKIFIFYLEHVYFDQIAMQKQDLPEMY